MANDLTKSTTNVNAPNMRFAGTFLDYEKNHAHATNGETLIDKSTGQIIFKRKTDGKFLFYSQENIHLGNYMTQLKSLIVTNRRDFVRPSDSICEFCNQTYFMTSLFDLVDFAFHEEEEHPRLLDGGVKLNPYAKEYSFCQESNGMFIQLNGRPRDRAVTSMMASMFDRYYSTYEGEDPEALSFKALYEKFGYMDSQAVLNYTLTYYDYSGVEYAKQTSDAYLRVNELTFVPFENPSIYPRTQVAYATIKVNSISTPKLAYAKDLALNENERAMIESLTDYEDLAFQTATIGLFMTSSDQNFKLPPEENATPILMMGLDEFENELTKVGNVAGSSGIVISVEEPDDTKWDDITIWGEIVRYVYSGNESEASGSVTKFEDLEKEFGSIDYHYGDFTMSNTELNNYLIELLGTSRQVETNW